LALGKGSRFNKVDAYRVEYADLPIIEIDGTKGTRQSRLESLMRIIREVQPDVVFSARIFDVYEAAALSKQRYNAPRLAIGIRAYEPQYLYDARCYRDQIDLCLTSGKLIAAACREWSKLDADRVDDIPGGISPPITSIKPRSPGRILKIGYVGRLEVEQKRIFDLVPFLQGLDSAHVSYTLDIVGSGPAEAELIQKLTPWIVSGRVKFHGWQVHDSLYTRFFPKIDCLVHFAYTEGVTIAPREAMVHGVVPVISRFIGLKTEGQFIHEMNALTFPVGDITTAIASIRRLITEPGLMERLSKMAINSQSGKYTFSGAMDAWADAFNRCLERPLVRGSIPKLNIPPDGRLARIGLSPWLAQRMRDLAGVRYIHEDPGSEWPTNSGLLTKEAAESIMRFAQEYELKLA
jgi:glycosyltransferase involved in cell wall biosynthesis